MKHRKWIVSGIAVVVVAASLSAQPRRVDTGVENRDFPNLQATEALQEVNILDAYNRLGELGWLVPMALQDMEYAKLERDNPYNFEYTFRFLQFTPRNTYIEYIKEDPDELLGIFGRVDDIVAEVQNEVDEAKQIQPTGEEGEPINAIPLDLTQGREGVRLTQYDFIYDEAAVGRPAVGSRRKSLSLYFDKTGTDDQPVWTLSLVVARVIHDNFQSDVTHNEIIIDQNPLDADDTPDLSDIIVMHRYNKNPTNVIILGTMHNTSTNPHRTMFKQDYYVKMLDHFFRLYRMVANYASKDDNDYNEEVIEHLERGMTY